MENPPKVPEHSDVNSQLRTRNELIHLIRKLRWMGMEDDAKGIEQQLADRRFLPGDNVVGGPRDTD